MPTTSFIRTARPLALVSVLALIAACSADSAIAPIEGVVPPPASRTLSFRGPYEMQNWLAAPISGGGSKVAPVAGPSDTAAFTYSVRLKGGGVTQRTTTFSINSATTGAVTFDYEYAAFHAYYRARADLEFYSVVGTDTVRIRQMKSDVVHSSFSRRGTITLPVEAGKRFGVRVGGSNYDSDSRLLGTVKLFNARWP